MAISSSQGAKVLLAVTNEPITNLHIQKILYMCHVFHLGRNDGKLLFYESFEAWQYGPVLPELYRDVIAFRLEPILDIWWGTDMPLKESSEYKVIQDIGCRLAGMSPSHLIAITHHPQGAWAKNYKPDVKGIKIPTQDIMEEYQKIYVKRK